MICLLCFEICNRDNSSEITNIIDLIEKHLPFMSTATVESPVMCLECWRKLEDFHNFYTMILETHKYYTVTSILDVENDEKLSSIEQDHNECIEIESDKDIHDDEESTSTFVDNIEIVDIESDKDVDDDEECDLSDNNETIESESDKDEDDDDDESISTTDNFVEINTDGIEFMNEIEETTQTEIEINDTTIEDVNPIDDKQLHITNSNTRRKYKKRYCFSSNELEFIAKYIQMVCDICKFSGKDFVDIIEHFDEDHPNVKPYVMCCEKKIHRRYEAIDHAKLHEDPKRFSCDKCDKCFTSGNNLRMHIKQKHVTSDVYKHVCDQCSKRFTRAKHLEMHKATHVPIEERQFFCDVCPKSLPYGSTLLLQHHMQRCHMKATNICHICGSTVRDIRKFEQHMRLHAGDFERIKCPVSGCDSWLMHKDSLRVHLRRHNGEQVRFACSKCPKSYSSKITLQTHVSQVHSKIRFKCNQCDKVFKWPRSLREHVTRQHSNEVLYMCDICSREFKSKPALNLHRKRSHK